MQDIRTRRPHQVKKLWRYIKRQAPRYVETPTIKTPWGRLVNRQEIAREVMRHVQVLNTPHPPRVANEIPPGYDEDHYMERDEQVGWEPAQVEREGRGDTIAEPFTEEEVERNVRKLKEGKAMGADNIPNEFMKHAGRHTIMRLTQVFNMVRDKEYLAPSWRSARMTMLLKGGDKELLNNYRGITINSNVGKLFMRMLTIRLKLDVEERGILG